MTGHCHSRDDSGFSRHHCTRCVLHRSISSTVRAAASRPTARWRSRPEAEVVTLQWVQGVPKWMAHSLSCLIQDLMVEKTRGSSTSKWSPLFNSMGSAQTSPLSRAAPVRREQPAKISRKARRGRFPGAQVGGGGNAGRAASCGGRPGGGATAQRWASLQPGRDVTAAATPAPWAATSRGSVSK